MNGERSWKSGSPRVMRELSIPLTIFFTLTSSSTRPWACRREGQRSRRTCGGRPFERCAIFVTTFRR
jgi:hypothetical protein